MKNARAVFFEYVESKNNGNKKLPFDKGTGRTTAKHTPTHMSYPRPDNSDVNVCRFYGRFIYLNRAGRNKHCYFVVGAIECRRAGRSENGEIIKHQSYIVGRECHLEDVCLRDLH